MSKYTPDMRVMYMGRSGDWCYSHAEFKTERGAQALVEKLAKRKPDVHYHVLASIHGTFRVRAPFSQRAYQTT